MFDQHDMFFRGTEDLESGTVVSQVLWTGEKLADPHIPIRAQVSEAFSALDLVAAHGTITVSGTPLINVDATGTITVSGTPLEAIANVYATGTITVSGGVPTADETITIAGHVYTFKSSSGGTYEITIGETAEACGTNIYNQVNTADSAHVTATNPSSGVVLITAVVAGAAGNALTLTESATNVAVSGSGTLESGVDARAADTMVVDDQTFTFKLSGSSTGDIVIDADNTNQAHNIAASISRDLTTVTADHLLGVVTITSVAHGEAGLSIVLTESATGVAVSGSGTLEGGRDADTLTVDDQEFTFVTTRGSTGEITVSAVNATQAANILTAINTDLESVVATRSDAVVTVTAADVGTAGNSIVLTENATGIAVSGDGTLEGGTDDTAGCGVELKLYTSDVEAFSGSPTLLATTGNIVVASLILGYQFNLGTVYKSLGYLRLSAVMTGTMDAGHIIAGISEDTVSSTVSPSNPPTGSRL